LVRCMVTVDGHVKGRGLARKSSAHCVDFSEREKGAKGMSVQRFSQELPEHSDEISQRT
jgi:hypothetical protein